MTSGTCKGSNELGGREYITRPPVSLSSSGLNRFKLVFRVTRLNRESSGGRRPPRPEGPLGRKARRACRPLGLEKWVT